MYLVISEIEYDSLVGTTFDLPQNGLLVVGRNGENDIVLRDLSVSRRHLEIQVEGTLLRVRDLGSKNGTKINGAPLPSQTETLVAPGGRIQIGSVGLSLELKLPQKASLLTNRAVTEEKAPITPRHGLASAPAPELAAVGAAAAPIEAASGRVASNQTVVSAVPVALAEKERPNQTVVAKPAIPIYRGAAIPAEPPQKPVIPLKVQDKKPTKSEKLAEAAFPNFMQMTSRVPQSVWNILRFISVITAIAVCTLAFVVPDLGLFIFWGFFIPVLPLVFFVAPGLWRNICPMATLNQLPRLGSFTRDLTLPKWLKDYSYVIGIGLFMSIVPARKVIFNQNGPALGVLMAVALFTAFLMGTLFKGKSGWCSSICPLLPVQRIYGQTPFMVVRNSHCQPCVGCTKNCYDFNPAVAYVADLHDDDPHYTNYRKLFAGAFPGLILAFYQVPNPPAISVLSMYSQFALYVTVSIGAFYALSALLRVSASKITALYAALAFNLYYWFNLPPLSARVTWLTGIGFAEWVDWSLQGVILLLTLVWLARTYQKEPLFIAKYLVAKAGATRARFGNLKPRPAATSTSSKPEVLFMPQDKRVEFKPDSSLLEIIECNNLQIEAGCRMGVCGADPVAILEGMENLSPVSQEEQNTLERLGLGGDNRLACCARVRGSVTVSLKPERQKMADSEGLAQEPFEYDPTVQRVVIIGNGIAGVTAADHIRRRYPDCEIHLVGREPHHLYNRMGISRLIYGRSALQGLHLLPDDWYDEYKINYWLNTQATRIDRTRQQVLLGTGERLDYDRLILAMGSRSTLPSFPGSNLDGVFVLREAADALAIRAYVQAHRSRRAVVVGGGLLGLEACYALQKLDLKVTVLERSDFLLRRQLDQRASQLLRTYLEEKGLEVALQADLAAVGGVNQVEQVILKDGRILSADLVLVAAGITPNTELAAEAGLAINRGVLVDDQMFTSDSHILAVGDLAEHRGQIYGLWPTAVEQGEIAAVNAIGGSKTYEGAVTAAALKIVGIELMSVGCFEPQSSDDLVITLEDTKAYRYRKLVVSQGKLVGAILMGYPELTPYITAMVKTRQDITPFLETLRAGGDWQKLV